MNINHNYFFFWADTSPFLGSLVPLFWVSADVLSGFEILKPIYKLDISG